MNLGGIRTLCFPLLKSILNIGRFVTGSGAGNVAPLAARLGLAMRGGHENVLYLLVWPFHRARVLDGPFRERSRGHVPAVRVHPGLPARSMLVLGGPFRGRLRPCEHVRSAVLASSSVSSLSVLRACGFSTGRTVVESELEKLPLLALPSRPFASTSMTLKVRLLGRVKTIAGPALRTWRRLLTRSRSSLPRLFLVPVLASSLRKGTRGLGTIGMPLSVSLSLAISVR